MSAPAPRAPASTAAVARHYLRLLANERTAGAIGLTVGSALLSGVSFDGFAGLPLFLWMMAAFPFLQWGIAERRERVDEAMPLDTVRHDLVRVACGAAWAAAALAAAIGLLALLWYPRAAGAGAAALAAYPVLLLSAGLTCYLLGAAVLTCRYWRGFFTGTLLVLGFLPFLAPTSQLARRQLLLSLREAPAPGELVAWATVQGVWTLATLAVVFLSLSASRWAPRLEARAVSGPWSAARAWMRRRRGLLAVHGPRPARVGAPRRPAPLHRVLWRELVILRLHMAGMGAALLLLTLWVEPTLNAIGANPNGYPWHGSIYSFSIAWPLAVWPPLAVPLRRRVQPLPVGAVAQRLTRVAAGAVWLEVAVLLVLVGRAASLAAWPLWSPSLAAEAGPWAGIASGALLLYLLGSVPLLLARDHLLGSLVWIGVMPVVGIPIARRVAPHARLSFESAMSAFAPHPGAWVGAMLLWIAVFASAAAGAAAWGVARERSAPSLEDATLALLRAGRAA